MRGRSSSKPHLSGPDIPRVQAGWRAGWQADRPDLRIPFSLMARRTVSGSCRVEGRERSRLAVEMAAAVNGIHVGTQTGYTLGLGQKAGDSFGSRAWLAQLNRCLSALTICRDNEQRPVLAMACPISDQRAAGREVSSWDVWGLTTQQLSHPGLPGILGSLGQTKHRAATESIRVYLGTYLL